jgi:hypothetical protein
MDTTELMQTLAKGLDDTLKEIVPGRRTNFSLIIWQDGEANYVSNADRESVKKALREVLQRWDVPGYKRQ